jgi:hypothetical protein
MGFLQMPTRSFNPPDQPSITEQKCSHHVSSPLPTSPLPHGNLLLPVLVQPGALVGAPGPTTPTALQSFYPALPPSPPSPVPPSNAPLIPGNATGSDPNQAGREGGCVGRSTA